MGVPGFFLWLMKKYNNTENKFIFEKEKLDNNNIFQEINNLDYLMIDCNCLLHPTCFKVLAEFNKSHDNNNMQSIDSTTFDKLENTMINECIKYIQHIIDYAKVKKTIYIAIDGVAPVAKIKQQRLRRFKTVSDKKLWDKNLIYCSKKVMPYSPLLETPLSNFEANSNYQERTDISVYVKFKILNSNENLLIWTTTPWSLFANQGICVNPELEYILIEYIKQRLYIQDF